MKKLLAGTCCALFALSLTACGSPAAASSSAPAAPASTSVSESVSAPPASSASEPASSQEAPAASASSSEEQAPVPRTIGDDGAVAFGNLHFQVDPSCSMKEDAQSLQIIYEEAASFVTIIASSLEGFDEGSALMNLMPDMMLSAYCSGFDSVSNQSDADVSVAGVTAKSSIFIAEVKGQSLNCCVLSFNAGNAYNYTVVLTESLSAQSHIDDFQTLLNGMTIDA